MTNVFRERAFTMVELLAGIAILAALTAVAIPSLSSTIQNNRKDAAASSIKAAIMLARSEAITRNQNVRIEGSTSGIYRICATLETADTCDPADENLFIRSLAIDLENIQVLADEAASDGIIFNSRGRLEMARSASLTLCHSPGDEFGIRVEVNRVGRASLKPIDISAGESCKPAA